MTKAAANASASQTLTGQTPAGPASAASIPPLRLHRVFSNKYPESEVTALAIADSGATSLSIAVGLAAGSVYLFSGDISGSKGKLHHTGKLNARPDTGEFWKINALAYKQQETKPSTTSSRKDKTTAAIASSSSASATAPAASGGKIAALSGRAGSSRAEAAAGSSSSEFAEQWLFVVTESQTLVFNMADQAKTILDQQGLSSSACAVMKDGMLIVARDDGLYEYTTDTRAGCTAYEGMALAVQGYAVAAAGYQQRSSKASVLHDLPTLVGCCEMLPGRYADDYNYANPRGHACTTGWPGFFKLV